MADLIDIQVLKDLSPGRFMAKEVPRAGYDSLASQFLELETEMNAHYDCDHTPIIHPSKASGTICIGRRVKDRKWYRVQIETVHSGLKGCQASCIILDYADTARIPIQFLREAHPSFLKLPFQALKFVLYGIQPLTMVTCHEEMTTSLQPCNRWDTSAVEHMKKLFKDSTSRQIRIMGPTDDKDQYPVQLYLHTAKLGRFCVNDELVADKYATYTASALANNPVRERFSASDIQSDTEAHVGSTRRVHTVPMSVSDAEDTLGVRATTRRKKGQRSMLQGQSSLGQGQHSLGHQGQHSLGHGQPSLGQGQTVPAAHSLGQGQPSLGQGQTVPAAHSLGQGQPSLGQGQTVPAADSLGQNQPSVGQGQTVPAALEMPQLISSGEGDGPAVVKTEASKKVTAETVKAGHGSAESVSRPTASGRPPSASPGSVSAGRGAAIANLLRHSPPVGTIAKVHVDKVSSPRQQTSPTQPVVSTEHSPGVSGQSLPAPSLATGRGVTQSPATPSQGLGRGMFRSGTDLLAAFNQSPPALTPSPTRPSPRVIALSKQDLSADVSSGSGSDSSRKYLSRMPKHAQSPEASPRAERLPGQLERSGGQQQRSQGQPVRSPARNLKSPQSVRFSDTEEVFDLSQRSPTSSPATVSSSKPLKSIIKTLSPGTSQPSSGSGSEHDAALEESGSSRPAMKVLGAAGDEQDGTEMSVSDGFRPQAVTEGKELLALVKPKGRGGYHFRQSSQETDIELQNPEMQGVFVNGRKKLRATYNLDDLPFAEHVKRANPMKDRLAPTKLQMFAWPAVTRGQDIAGVAPPRGGKVYAYLPPLLLGLSQHNVYADLPQGGGPLALVVCPSWKRANQVYGMAEELLQRLPRVHPLLLVGGTGSQSESMLEIPLVNGCELLVCTPHCVLRMLEKGVTSLNRLCHLVLEDADVLTEEFTPQIRRLMEIYATELKDLQSVCAPRQKLIFASQWTAGMESFVHRFMPDPLVLIACKNEAAFYGGVQQICTVCHVDQRIPALLDMAFNGTQKTVIFTQNSASAINIHKALQSQSCFTLLAHRHLTSIETDLVRSEWDRVHSKDSMPILVVTDDFVDELELCDAEVVVHFDMPRDRLGFGQRLWCMRKHFAHPFDPKTPEQSKSAPKTFSRLLVTEQCGPPARDLVQILKHYGAQVPPLLHNLAEKQFEQREQEKGRGKVKVRELCPFLKAFGWCREERKCNFRHVILKTLDSPSPLLQNVPFQGNLKVLVQHVEDAGCYYGRLLEYRSESGEVIDLKESFYPLLRSLSYSARKQPISVVPEVGQLYFYESTQHTFHRVKILEVSEVGKKGIPPTVHVQFIDKGGFGRLETLKLLELPEEFQGIDPQAVEIRICCVRPVDEDTDWTERASVVVSEEINNKEMEGNIVLILGNTVWLDPLVQRRKLQSVGATINERNVRAMLLENGMAQQNPLHMHLLYAACEKQMDLAEYRLPENSTHRAYTAQGRLVTPQCVGFPDKEVEPYVKVVVTAVDSPDLIYVQLCQHHDRWQALHEDIQTHIKYTLEQNRQVTDLRKGTLVLAKYPIDNKWYRAKVAERAGDGKYDLFLVDTGEYDYIAECDLRPLPMRLLTLPFQAVECTIVGITSTDDTSTLWPESVGDTLWDLVGTSDTASHQLYAQVMSQSEALRSGRQRYGVRLGRHRYGVRLYDTAEPYDVDMVQLLIAEGCARPDSTFIQKVTLTADSDAPSQIHSLCADLLSQKTVDQQAVVAEQLHTLVTATDRQEDHILQTEAHKCLCDTLAYVSDPRVIQPLASCVASLAQASERLACEMSTTAINTVCRLLDNHAQPQDMQESLSLALQAFSSYPECSHTAVLRGGLRILCVKLAETQAEQVHKTASKTLLLLLNEENTREFSSSGSVQLCMEKLCQCLRQTTEDEVLYNCLCALEMLAHHSQLKDVIRKHGGLKCVCEVAESSNSIQLLECCAKVLRALASNNRFNKDAMNDMDMISTLQRLSGDTRLSIETKTICTQLRNRLHSVMPSELHKNSPNRPSNDPLRLGGSPVVRGSPRGVSPRGSPRGVSPESDTPAPPPPPSSPGSGRGILGLGRGLIVGIGRGTPVLNGQQHMPLKGIRPLSTSQVINNRPLPARYHSSVVALRSEKPQVMWSQDKWNILLTVRVPMLKKPDYSLVKFTEDHIDFRVVSESVEYSFSWRLYEVIVPDQCQEDVRSSETHVGLRKASRGRWPRLLREKQRLPYLKPDYQRYQDSSSDSEADDEESIQAPLDLAKRNVDRIQPFANQLPGGRVGPDIMEDQVTASFATGSDGDSDSSGVDDLAQVSNDPFQQRDHYNIFGV